jgi:hypothetical protein
LSRGAAGLGWLIELGRCRIGLSITIDDRSIAHGEEGSERPRANEKQNFGFADRPFGVIARTVAREFCQRKILHRKYPAPKISGEQKISCE